MLYSARLFTDAVYTSAQIITWLPKNDNLLPDLNTEPDPLKYWFNSFTASQSRTFSSSNLGFSAKRDSNLVRWERSPEFLCVTCSSCASSGTMSIVRHKHSFLHLITSA